MAADLLSWTDQLLQKWKGIPIQKLMLVTRFSGFEPDFLCVGSGNKLYIKEGVCVVLLKRRTFNFWYPYIFTFLLFGT